MELASDLNLWLAGIPKIELHCHLEGAIPLPALWELVQKYRGAQERISFADLQARFVYRDFQHFIDTWVWKNQFLREYDDFTFIAAAIARDLAEQQVRYVEFFFSPPDFSRHGLQPQRLAEAIRRGLAQVPKLESYLIADLVRDFGPELGMRTLQAVAEVQDQGVIGVGLGGSELQFPPEPYRPVFERARQLRLHTVAHAGEAAGPSSIWGALNALQAERIGHGTRATEDRHLVEYLAEKQVPLEMCPISNLRTNVVTGLAEHPIRRFFKQGLLVTVNTDDPKMFGNSLVDEFTSLIQVHDFTQDEIRQLILNGIRSAFITEARRTELIKEFTQDPAW